MPCRLLQSKMKNCEATDNREVSEATSSKERIPSGPDPANWFPHLFDKPTSDSEDPKILDKPTLQILDKPKRQLIQQYCKFFNKHDKNGTSVCKYGDKCMYIHYDFDEFAFRKRNQLIRKEQLERNCDARIEQYKGTPGFAESLSENHYVKTTVWEESTVEATVWEEIESYPREPIDHTYQTTTYFGFLPELESQRRDEQEFEKIE